MTNDVLRTLEETRDADALTGGAYTYILTYTNTKTKETIDLFNSDTVGGEKVEAASASRKGLHEATDALKNWLYLDTFKQEKELSTYTLNWMAKPRVMIIKDTLARAMANFAVELNNNESKKTKKQVITQVITQVIE